MSNFVRDFRKDMAENPQLYECSEGHLYLDERGKDMLHPLYGKKRPDLTEYNRTRVNPNKGITQDPVQVANREAKMKEIRKTATYKKNKSDAQKNYLAKNPGEASRRMTLAWETRRAD